MPVLKPQMYIQLSDEDEINVEDICSDLKFLKEEVTPAPTNNYQEDAGSDGSILNYTSYAKNVVNAYFWLHFTDYYDFKLKCHEIYRVFNARKKMRIRTDAEPAIVEYVRPGTFEIKPVADYDAHDCLFTVPFDNPSGYKYSLANSDELMSYDNGVWQLYGQNILNGTDVAYTFDSETSFQVYNASDIDVDPYYQRHTLNIIMKHSGGAFTLTNKTNGTSWAYKSGLTSSDELILQGLNTYKNGNLDNNNTDFGYIKLDKGWNTFKVSGATDLNITFSFPFIYIG